MASRLTKGTKGYEEILDAAALSFQTRGYDGASIDAVARSMNSTKGRVYHYFPSKVDLFNAVRERAMDLAFDALRGGYESDGTPLERLTIMAHEYVRVMMRHQPYMQVLVDGLQRRRHRALTEEQRGEIKRHLSARKRLEQQFREVVLAAQDAGEIQIALHSVTLQTFLMALGGPVLWYSPRPDETPEDRKAIAEDIVKFGLRGLGVADDKIESLRKSDD
ncbi:MAG: TetR/AcrR family transcriptional regulator [Mangrovicoccus sp.]|nr:TetR/AcrR family transcriptional regulator [Mangrovicoccus sp.]